MEQATVKRVMKSNVFELRTTKSARWITMDGAKVLLQKVLAPAGTGGGLGMLNFYSRKDLEVGLVDRRAI